MAIGAGYLDYLGEQLAGLGDVSFRKMFGGAGVYHGGRIFGVVDDDVLYFKVDDRSRGAYEHRGMGPFRPYADGPPMRAYHQVPAEIVEDREELVRWAREAIAAAERLAAERAPRPGKPRSARGR